MEKVLRDIKLIKKIDGDIYFHDPFYDDFKHQYMKFARPVYIITKQWDPVMDGWETISCEEFESYYRPSEFYDFYVNPSLINKQIIKKYSKYFTKESDQMKILNLMNENTDFIKALQIFIKNNRYRIIENIPLPHKFQKTRIRFISNNTIFDETWNTCNYSHLLLPRRYKYFVNPEKLTCTCKFFHNDKKCVHIIDSIIARILMNKLGNADVLPIIKGYICENQ